MHRKEVGMAEIVETSKTGSKGATCFLVAADCRRSVTHVRTGLEFESAFPGCIDVASRAAVKAMIFLKV